MEEYVSFHKILDLLQDFQEDNPRLNSFGYGNLVDFGKNVSGTTVVYPFLFIVPLSIQYDENTTTYQVTAIFADRLNETLDNEKDCVSDMSLCARDLLSQIKRGDLMDYMETILPAQAQPFMERFNDNVAGVALDLYIQIIEDINACVQYPTPTPSQTPDQPTPTVTPTPSVTPSVTPTQTITPTVTQTPGLSPTVTPTVTQTPSPTSSTVSPSTLGALWWIDFTDAATLTVTSGNIEVALDKIANVPFTATTNQGPQYDATGYLGISGDARSNAAQLRNGTGAFGTFSEYTWWGTVYDSPAAQRGGRMFIGTNNGDPWPSGTAFSIMLDGNFNPYPPGPVWRFQNRANNGQSVVLDTNIQFDTWTAVAMRSYNQGGDCIFEMWENGSLVMSGSLSSTSALTVNNPIFSMLFDGGLDFSTEQFFFDRKLSDAEMAQVMTYLGNKY